MTSYECILLIKVYKGHKNRDRDLEILLKVIFCELIKLMFPHVTNILPRQHLDLVWQAELIS